MTGTLVVSNDFGPRIGGIETFVGELVAHLPGEVVVLTGRQRGSEAYDARLSHPVVRRPDPVLLPTPAVAEHAARLLRDHGLDRVLFGASAPLGLLAGRLRRAGAHRVVALSHGHEVWWAAVPFSRPVLRRIVAGCDVVGVISDYTRRRIAAALPPDLHSRLIDIPPPVDTDLFRPGAPPLAPVVVSAGRFVPRKGFDTLLDAWARAVDRLPVGAELRIAGSGPDERRLRRLARGLAVTFVGPVNHDDMPAFLRQGRLFASPVRTHRRGLTPEGFGLVFAEAASCGLPVLVGNSGGAPATVLDGVSGHVLDPHDAGLWGDALVELLTYPERARAAGLAGRAHAIATVAVGEVTQRVADALRLEGPLR